MKFRLISAILAISLFSATIPVFAENAHEYSNEYNITWGEAAPTAIPQNDVYYAVDEEQEEISDEHIVHQEILSSDIKLPEEDLTAGSLPEAGNPTFFSETNNIDERWIDVLSTQFGSDYLKPYEKREEGQRVTDNTNRLVIEETDLSLPGKNGLDLVIKRRNDNQDYNEIYTYKRDGEEGYIETPTYIYAFKNTKTGQSISVAFYTVDDFYTYMADGCYLKAVDSSEITTYKHNGTTYSFYEFSNIKKLITDETSGTLYQYDSSIENVYFLRTYDHKYIYRLESNKLFGSQEELGNNWILMIPSVYLYRTSYEIYPDTKYKDYEYYYMGAFRDINGNVYSLEGNEDFTVYVDESKPTTYTSDFGAEGNEYLSVTKLFNSEAVCSDSDSPQYNFKVVDSNGLTYYLYNAKGTEARNKNQSMRIVAIEDEYGNMIKYQYDSSYENLTSIIDTYGRTIEIKQETINEQDDKNIITTISYYDEVSKETKSIVYETSELESSELDNDSPIKQKKVQRFTVTNQHGEQTIYDSRETEVINFYSSGDGDINTYPAFKDTKDGQRSNSHNIERIIYPTGAETRYKYKCIYISSLEDRVLRGQYAVVGSYDIVDNKEVNKKEYSLSGTSTSVNITQQDEAANKKATSTYNKYGLITSIKTTPIDKSSPASSITYGYNSTTHKPSSITVNNQISTNTTYYSYAESYPDRLLSERTDKRQIQYTYHTNNNDKATNKVKTAEYQYKSGTSATAYTTDYVVSTELTDNKASIEYERITTKDNHIHSQIKYEYDTEGNIISAKQWTSDTNGDEKLDENDAFDTVKSTYVNTEQKTKNITNTVADIKNADGLNEGNVTSEYKLNIYGSPTYFKDSYGTETTVEYDDLNRPVKYNMPNGASKTISYNIDSSQKINYTIVTDESGIQYKYVYDGIGRIKEKLRLSGTSWVSLEKYTYDDSGRLSEKISGQEGASPIKEVYTYDALDRPLTKKLYENSNTLLYTETYSYAIGKITKTTTAADGTLTADIITYYDKYGNVTKTETKSGNDILTTAYEYDYLDRQTKATNPNGNSITYEYDCKGQLVKQTNPDNTTILTQYDLAGQAISATDANGNTSNTEYDALGRAIKVTAPFDSGRNAITKTYYDKNSNVVKTSVRKDNDTYSSTEYKYDSMGNLLASIAGEGSEQSVVQYQYDTAGRLTKMITGLTAYSTNPTGGAVTSYTYNNDGFLDKVTDPMGNSEKYTQYDKYGNVKGKTNKNGNILEYTYGAYGIKSEKANLFVYNDTTYNSLGQVIKTTGRNQNGERSEDSYTYDAFGRMTSKTSHDGTVQSYTYDNNSNVLSYNMAKDGETKNSITYTYNSMDRLTELDNNGIIGYKYLYDNNGNLTLKLNTKTANFDLEAEYNAANLPTSYTTGTRSKTYDYNIVYFVNGQKIYEYDHASDAYKTYDYNSLGQLETETNSQDNNVAEFDYTYDASGNRIKMRSFNNTLKKWDTVTDYTYNANNQLTESTTKVNNDLTETNRYYYDDNGNTIAEQKKTYTTDGNISSDMAISGRAGSSSSVKLYGYDYFNRLIKYNDGKTTAEYTYGADNLRTSKTVNGTKTDFVWNGQNLAGETKDGTETVYTYDQTGIIASKKGNDTAESFFKDAHGNVIAVSKGSNIASTHDYTAFGNKWQGDAPDPFGYCGEYLDSESGLIYLRNRYYDSDMGRFINEDPIKDGLNWYSYCAGNPVNLVDPSGLIDIMLRYAVEKNNGSIVYNNDGTATVTMNNITHTYSGTIINGRMYVDDQELADDFNMPAWLFTVSESDEFYSADDAAAAFGGYYNNLSCKPNEFEYQAFIYENPNGTFSYGDVTKGVDLGNGFRTVLAPSPDINRVLASWAHTHGPYPDSDNPDKALDLFTGRNEFYDAQGNLTQIIGDGSYSHSLGVGGYVFTPGGEFKYLDYTQWPEHVTTWIPDSDPAVRVISTNFTH